ncbi:unnamed protein product [Lactuca virosa]|uniref:Uncharacterized protein n=1 Tax=Lactuca virosa TaxID=75947 RepID=A0AAU9N399_9ASTR|nr:unnamed protein product [Lactuca virosa]
MPNSDQVQDIECTYVDAQNAQTAKNYNVLLNQYNDVEEQRQKLLGQLYQYGNSDYQSYGYGGGYDSQDQPPQPSGPPACSCQPYVCPCSTSVSCNEYGDVIKAAMGAVDKGKKREETDLSAVLNAWFSAGFYTPQRSHRRGQSPTEGGTGGEQVGQAGQRQGQQQQGAIQQRQVVVWRFQIAIHLDLMLILKLAAVIDLFNQDGLRKMLVLLIFFASLIYL